VAPMLRGSAGMYGDANNFETRRATAVSSVLASRHFAMSGPLRPDRRVVHSGDVASGPRTVPERRHEMRRVASEGRYLCYSVVLQRIRGDAARGRVRPRLVDLLPVLSKDELVHAGHGEGQHATFGSVDQALLDEFIARDREVTGARFAHAGCQRRHRRCPVTG
jgi:hypothetical protein